MILIATFLASLTTAADLRQAVRGGAHGGAEKARGGEGVLFLGMTPYINKEGNYHADKCAKGSAQMRSDHKRSAGVEVSDVGIKSEEQGERAQSAGKQGERCAQKEEKRCAILPQAGKKAIHRAYSPFIKSAYSITEKYEYIVNNKGCKALLRRF